ncbi:NAD(P)/FAD-dependent oxidoreductase [Vagococcus lutrae]|uniref:NAD(P)/FAD-dependent oxidoreductase n=1 Tax=Vagococcus lutrae TaxID=81947 RepID=UPI00289076A0|nr:NAD(P)/FAD-dependent oxidoreductase [Vagococcus lutrae]MDT2802325.1 NAD(P)/FAD-dependent oxidoreductase [Vagococcus lutrae]MDT2826605.1 NAD(P)/FAD-dependent oxidoreductase [Vagococcus lutrae]MDT2842822.1 NAD(P)/FAD-dependent oxidoreductase [Vagococcus lutrae]
MSETKEIFDIIIIGGGPVGMFASFYAGMRQAKTMIIESLPALGGQLTMLYPEKEIYDVAGFPHIKAKDLVTNLHEQIDMFNHDIHLEETVKHIEPLENQLLEVTTSKGLYITKSVIIAAGNGSFQPRRLKIDDIEPCEQKSMHYHITNLERFRDKEVLIAGGGDSAIDWALTLENIAKTVHVVHRRNQFRALEHSVDLLKQSSVQVHTPYVIQAIEHKEGQIHTVTLHNPKEDLKETLMIDELIVNYGYSSSLGPIKNWGLDLNKQSISVNSDMSTNIPGVYACGDIVTYDGKVALIATGFGEAPTAVNNALHFANPDLRVQPGHSTSLFEKNRTEKRGN